MIGHSERYTVFQNFNFDKAPSIPAARKIAVQWYGHRCALTGYHVSAINEFERTTLQGSHLLPSGEYVEFAAYPIAILPKTEPLHAEYERIKDPGEKYLWLCAKARQSPFRDSIKIHLQMFSVLMIQKGYDSGVFFV